MPKYPELAETLESLALLLPESTTLEKQAIYSHEGLTIKCIPQRDKLQQIAAKYRKGHNLMTTTKHHRTWGVAANKRLNRKMIETRYRDDPDHQQFMELLK